MTPATITITMGWAILDGPSIDGFLDSLKNGGTVELTMLPHDAENLRRKLKLKARVRQIGNLHTTAVDRVRSWRAKVEFIGNPRFRVTNTSPVEILFYTSGHDGRDGGRGGVIFDTTPDDEKLWVAQGDGSIVRGLHFGRSKIIGNIRDLPVK